MQGFRGKLQLELSLMDLVQVSSFTGRSGKLVIKSGADVGTVYLKEGHVVGAEAGGKTGEDAFYSMALWGDGEFLFAATDVDAETTVKRDINSLLLEAARRRDESGQDKLKKSALMRIFPEVSSRPAQLSPLQESYQAFLREKQRVEAHSGAFRRSRAPGEHRDDSPVFGLFVLVFLVAFAAFIGWLLWNWKAGRLPFP